MVSWKTVALTTVRLPRGAPPPSEESLRDALLRDRAVLHLPPGDHTLGITVAGPYPVSIAGQELDEYVVWEC
jgi:hypothetical protein